ncbi:hypothetical protein JD969_05630 [Planctomycetota bacterium]|nr:hypothetical protein JD969_05630 [Planctomycetota bacterium]
MTKTKTTPLAWKALFCVFCTICGAIVILFWVALTYQATNTPWPESHNKLFLLIGGGAGLLLSLLIIGTWHFIRKICNKQSSLDTH